ncbi:MAG: type II secretion system protein N, partial [Rhodoferax sp.]|nr:type II secretion system protein N [Rhodoferax sp.]
MARIRSAFPAVPGNRAPWAWMAGGCLVGLCLALLLFAPARWLAAQVGQAS